MPHQGQAFICGLVYKIRGCGSMRQPLIFIGSDIYQISCTKMALVQDLFELLHYLRWKTIFLPFSFLKNYGLSSYSSAANASKVNPDSVLFTVTACPLQVTDSSSPITAISPLNRGLTTARDSFPFSQYRSTSCPPLARSPLQLPSFQDTGNAGRKCSPI